MVSSVSIQYAKAIFELALANQNENNYYQDLLVIKESFIDDEKTKQVFSHPSISTREKKEILSNVLNDKINAELLHYLFVLVDNNRFLDLPDIVDTYQKLLDEYQEKLVVDVYTKYQLEEKQKQQIVSDLSKIYHASVMINEVIDETLIGGIKMMINGNIIDNTISKQLDILKTDLKKGW